MSSILHTAIKLGLLALCALVIAVVVTLFSALIIREYLIELRLSASKRYALVYRISRAKGLEPER